MRWKIVFALLLSVSSLVYADVWSDTYSAIDNIIFSVEQLEGSNNSLQNFNSNLVDITNQQARSLHQWETNWAIMQQQLQILNTSLSSYEIELKIYRIYIPLVTAALVGLTIWSLYQNEHR